METIKQKTVVLEIEGGPRIEVKRMRWKAAREFLRKLGAVVSKIFVDGRVAAGAEATGHGMPELSVIERIAVQLPAIIEQSEELATLLCTQSTGLTAQELDNLDLLAGAEVLRTALEVNLDDETKNSFAGSAARIRGVMPARKEPPQMTS
jgi:hypothetical protein